MTLNLTPAVRDDVADLDPVVYGPADPDPAPAPEPEPVEDDRPTLPGTGATISMADGTRFEVRVCNPDLLLWDKTAPGRGWTVEKTPFLFATFTAWAAAKRAGLTALRFEQFQAEALQIDLQEADPVRPTR